MEPTEDKPPNPSGEPLNREKTTAPPTMPGWTPRQAADWGIWSGGGQPGMPRKYPYSIT